MNAESHPLYPERETRSITIRGVEMPGLFTGPAAIVTHGSAPRVVGPFEDVLAAQQYMAKRGDTGSGHIFPLDAPEASS